MTGPGPLNSLHVTGFKSLRDARITLGPLNLMVGANGAGKSNLIALQSVTLANQVQPEDLIVVEREDDASVFRRLDAASLSEWLDDYGTGDLWAKNLIGGTP